MSLQMGVSLQPGIRDSLVFRWERDMDDYCFRTYALLHWVRSESERFILADNGDAQLAPYHKKKDCYQKNQVTVHNGSFSYCRERFSTTLSFTVF